MKPRRQELFSFTVGATGQKVTPVNGHLMPGVTFALTALYGAEGYKVEYLGCGRLYPDGFVEDLIPA